MPQAIPVFPIRSGLVCTRKRGCALALMVALLGGDIPNAKAATVVPGAGSIQVNGSAHLGAQSLVLTDSASDNGSAWYTTPLALDQAFRVTFQYRVQAGALFSPFGGFSLVLQGAPTGTATLGRPSYAATGGAIAHSFALALNVPSKSLRLLADGNTGLVNRTDWNLLGADGLWEHGQPGYALPAGLDPDATRPACALSSNIVDSVCTVGAGQISLAQNNGAFVRLYDHYYLGHGMEAGGTVADVDSGDWVPVEISFLPNLQDRDGSLAIRYRFGAAANGQVGYVDVRDYFYLPGTPQPADGSFWAGLPEYMPTTNNPYYLGFVADTGNQFQYGVQDIQNWTIETGIENDYLDTLHPVPEPSAAALLGLGLAALACLRRPVA